MHAHAGDWLIVEGRTDARPMRRGEILSVSSPTGEPPYTVHWIDTDTTTIVFPGPDALVVSAARLEEIDRDRRSWEHG